MVVWRSIVNEKFENEKCHELRTYVLIDISRVNYTFHEGARAANTSAANTHTHTHTNPTNQPPHTRQTQKKQNPTVRCTPDTPLLDEKRDKYT